MSRLGLRNPVVILGALGVLAVVVVIVVINGGEDSGVQDKTVVGRWSEASGDGLIEFQGDGSVLIQEGNTALTGMYDGSKLLVEDSPGTALEYDVDVSGNQLTLTDAEGATTLYFPEYPFPVQTFEDQGTEHLEPDQTYDLYNSDPPTTGPHAPAPAEFGVHDMPVAKEVLPHNMEHGGVIVLYDCSAGVAPLDDAGCQNLRDQLEAITEENVADGKLVLMAPYSGMEHPIVLTAWRTLDAFDQFDEQRVQAFIDSFDRKFNPEGF